jgi:hypothetical protein
MTEEERLGDKAERIINKLMPKTAARMKESGCGCEKRKEWLNNLDRRIRK